MIHRGINSNTRLWSLQKVTVLGQGIEPTFQNNIISE